MSIMESWASTGLPLDMSFWPRAQDSIQSHVATNSVKVQELIRYARLITRFKPAVTYRRNVRDVLEEMIIARAHQAQCSVSHLFTL